MELLPLQSVWYTAFLKRTVEPCSNKVPWDRGNEFVIFKLCYIMVVRIKIKEKSHLGKIEILCYRPLIGILLCRRRFYVYPKGPYPNSGGRADCVGPGQVQRFETTWHRRIADI